MPPHAAETNMIVDQDEQGASVAAATKNVTFAINYQVSLVDEFVASPRTPRRVVGSSLSNPTQTPVETVPESTASLIPNCTNPTTPSNSNNNSNAAVSKKDEEPSSLSANISENSAPNSSDEETSVDNNNNAANTSDPTSQEQLPAGLPPPPFVNNSNNNNPHSSSAAASQQAQTRRSARGKLGKRDKSLARTRVRYDMQIVPPTHRNKAFLSVFPPWWMQPQRPLTASSSSTSSSPTPEYPACNTCVPPSIPPPFSEDTSVVWIPTKRTEWEDSVSEMTAVCTSAALHRHVASVKQGGDKNKNNNKPFHAPLSRDYIRDRVDIDDPLQGYQIRHKTGGWLQGFCLWTNFTTWTHYFKWDSLHEQSGMAAFKSIPNAQVDRDGSLAQELEEVPREGDPLGGGIVFSSIAEIGLVGALGCGEYLLRMALDSIREKKQYKFVVLQATDSSKTFYERFGFVRVGAICRYYVGNSAEQQPIVGYRHWTHANESDASLQMHGGPSYMMCLKLPPIDSTDVCTRCGRPAEARSSKPSFLQSMMTLRVEEKPTIEQLGGGSSSTTPASLYRSTGHQRRNSKAASVSSATEQRAPSNVAKKKAASASAAAATSVKRKPSPKVPARTIVKPAGSLPPTRVMKRRLSSTRSYSGPLEHHHEPQPPASKKHKPSGWVEKLPREVLLSPPPAGKSLSYAQKQYQSVWLAVPPDAASDSTKRRPPPKWRRRMSEPIGSTSFKAASSTTARKRTSISATKPLDKPKQAPPPSVAAEAQRAPAEPVALAAAEATTKPHMREIPKRAAAAAAAAAFTASCTRDSPKKSDKTHKTSVRDASKPVRTPPTRELPKRAASMPKPSTTPSTKDTRKSTAVRAKTTSKKTKAAKPNSDDRLFYSVRGPDGRFVRVPIGSTITYTKGVKPSAASKKAQSTSKSTITITSVKVKHGDRSKPAPVPPVKRGPGRPRKTAPEVKRGPGRPRKTVPEVKRGPGRPRKADSEVKRGPGRPRKADSEVKRGPGRPKKTVPAVPGKPKKVERSTLRKQKVHSYPRARPHFYNRVVKPADGTKKYFFVLNYDDETEQLRLAPMEAKNKLTGQREGRPRYQCVIGDTDDNFVTVSAEDYQVVPSTMVMKTPFVALEAWDIQDD